MKIKYFILLFLVIALIILPNLQGQASPVYLGKGCTTLTYMDYDCDGYVIGGKDGHAGSYSNLAFPIPINLEADANDDDYTLNNLVSVTSRYGGFNNVNNFKQYLYDLGYNYTINNVFFVSLNGDDSTAQINNINLPYRNIPRLNAYALPSSHLIRPGDVVVLRGGIWPVDSLSTFGSFECIPNVGAPGCSTVESGVQGTSTNPILFINHPGERVIIKGQSGGQIFGPSRNTTHVIIDGFEFDGTDPNTGQVVANEIFRFNGPMSHITFRNLELRNAQTWGVFGALTTNKDYIVFDKVSIHHINDQHCIYRNDQSTTGTTVEDLDTDFGWVIKNSIFYNCRFNGIQWRGGKNATFDSNIIHTTGLNGIDLKDSPEDIVVKNNLFFNNGHGSILIFEDNDPQRFGANGADNILITNNIFAARSGINGAGGENSAFPAVRLTHLKDIPRTHKNINIYNNIIYSTGATPIYFDYFPDINETRIEKNIIYRVGASSSTNGGGMSVLNWTDGSHTSTGLLFGLPLYIWEFDAMQNIALRPKINNNLFANPNFQNADNAYTTQFTPWLYDFNPNVDSPNINFSLIQYATSFDLKGKTRDNSPDAGAYEYGNSSNGGSTTGSTTGTTTSSSTGSGSSGSSGGSNKGTTGFTSFAQCNDELDNDGDNLIDFPNDIGCVSFNDDSELNIGQIAGDETNELDSITLDNEERPFEVRIVLWFLFTMLIILIIAILILIIRNLRVNARHTKGSYY